MDTVEVKSDHGQATLLAIMEQTELGTSQRRDAELIQCGAVTVNGHKVDDLTFALPAGPTVLDIRVGKRRQANVVIV